MKVEEAMRETYPYFKGFHHDASYLDRYNSYLDNFDELMAQVPREFRDREETPSAE